MIRGVPLKYSVRNLWRRPARTLMTVLGLALLVGLVVFLTAFGRTFGRVLRLPGDPQHLIVLSKKAQTFELSSIPRSELDAMASDVSESLETDEDGEPLFSKEVYHFLNVHIVDDPEEKPRRALVHGMDPEYARYLLPGFRLIEGRLPEPDMNELLVGRSVARKLRVPEKLLRPARPGRDGGAVEVRDTVYDVVGVFEAPGTLYENWMLTGTSDLQVTLGRRDYSFARMRVKPGVDVEALARRLSLDERYSVNAMSEEAYFADFAEGFSHFRQFSMMLALILGIGGILAGMNTLHNAVVGRIREIGTLRVLGFSKGKILLAFLIESLLLTGMAGILGCGLGLLANGLPMRVPLAATFPVVVDGPALAVGFVTALLMGALGLSFPLWKALRLDAVDAVRAV